MSYDAAALRRLGANPKNWKWFNADYDRYRVNADGTRANDVKLVKTVRMKPGRFILSILLLVVIFGVVAVVSVAQGTGMVVNLLFVAAFIGAATLCHTGPTALKVIGYVALVIAAYLTLTPFYLHAPLSLGVALQFTFFSWLIGWLLTSSFTRTTKVTKAARRNTPDVAFDRATRIFGTPGGVADAAGKFGQDAVDAGVRGEQNTAALLDLLLKIPGTSVFHGLRFPGSATADVDHAVVHGSLVYLIDSKMYRWGEYGWKHGDKGDQIVRSDGYGMGKTNHMDAAAEGYRSILGPEIYVVPLIIVHGTNVTIARNPMSENGVAMLTADDAMRHIGDNFHKRMLGWKDNPKVRSVLLQNMK